MTLALYRKYRPQNFSSVVGQKSAIDVLTSALAKNRPGHAYLFSGSRGCGKTSVARIFAKALNCLAPQGVEPCGKCSNCVAITAGESLDVIEIDGASNNGVEEIRELKSNVTLAPFSSKYKIYIIDEVHMLSQAAFNALLKTLEEPPEHVIFIMATTEPQKVPVTIRSRCQHIPFHSIRVQDIFTRLKEICALENVNAEDSALLEISRQADGALRDSLSLLEQIISSGDVTLANVESALGVGSRSSFENWINILRVDMQEAYKILKSMFDSGANPVRVFEEIFSLVRDLWLVSKWRNIANSLGASERDQKFLLDESPKWQSSDLHRLLIVVLKLLRYARSGMKSDILLGMFQLGLTSSPRPAATQTQSQTQTISQPARPVTNIQANTSPPEDPELKQKLLAAIKPVNFKIYCALLDSRTYEQDGNLIIDMLHRYCYEFLRLDQQSAVMTELFDGYQNIVLKFGLLSHVCYKSEKKLLTPAKQENQAVSTPAPAIKNQVKQQQSNSALERVIRALSASQLNAEILLTFDNSTDDEENNNDDLEGDNDE
ncbi:MAG: DNA polymerase III subunit gamma/tau [Synergistaceae bacterium]|nr:DNA polymerase III subunit gamma/tau [Synergistaceae bacterium]